MELRVRGRQACLGPDGVFGDGIKSPAKQLDAALKTGCLDPELGRGTGGLLHQSSSHRWQAQLLLMATFCRSDGLNEPPHQQ